jgi:uncharacterized membrane protein
MSETTRFPAVAQPRPRPQQKRRRQPFPRLGWVLAICAFVCGAMLSAAAFSIGWKHQAQKGSSAQAALVAATARTHLLASSLSSANIAATHARVAARRARARAVAAQASTAALLQRAQGVATALNDTSGSANAVTAGASSVGSDLAKLTSELRTLTSYLDTTPSAQLDSGYVAAQTAYITKTISRISGEQNDLGAAVSAYMHTVEAAAARAAALSGKN